MLSDGFVYVVKEHADIGNSIFFYAVLALKLILERTACNIELERIDLILIKILNYLIILGLHLFSGA